MLLLLKITLLILFYWLKWLSSMHEDCITIHINAYYPDEKTYTKAVSVELIEQGKKVSYKGNRIFHIDGAEYFMHELTIPNLISPTKQIILKRRKYPVTHKYTSK
ncbi:hypothetical protein D8M04_09740 [Oceanobacillus piezotolerans]|uniref:Uncharacterized protein n=1 Tax=Oceanobacillus piezotolerans TaxID=2448030 RepID=A0A498D6R4_9BACI|nr:hypothetical protein [Oceanobacillus piezotolerans]RLL45136.1 hypothetical protein D8M04_09740 [Oceanobacillus piezotolerans]